jgi:hypothetical protein
MGPTAPQLQEQVLKLSHLIVAADVAAVAYVEKVLAAGHKATAGHLAVAPAAPKELIIVGLIFALPALLILLAGWLRQRGTAAAAPAAQRSVGYPFKVRP